MQFTFLNSAGTVLFVRDDLESGGWQQDEYTVNLTFPYIPNKVIREGMRLCFRDPVTDTIEVFEIRNAGNYQPEAYQQITAEHIAVSELSDEHINTTEITDKTPAQALTTVLTGTLWAVGNSSVSAVQSVDVSRGSVWQAVNAIQQNFNVYIVPRLTFNAAGAITGRYLDITPAAGTFRGLRLSIDKNLSDVCVTYDDSEVLTALYGYGGSVDVPQTGGQQDKTEELTFKDIVWTATGGHPAKPSGQTFLEYPEKTAVYGRNGRPRYGYYQNSNIKDANVLLEKTWEALQRTCDPKINITGTATELTRFGYAGQPIRLHDSAIVEVRPTGEVFTLEIIKNYVDFIDPTACRPEIGKYIPNIIYINRDTASKAGGRGGGGGRGQTNIQHEDGEFYTEFFKTQQKIGMVVGTYNGGYKIQGGEITLAINDDGGTTAKLAADTIDIQGLIDELAAYDLSTETMHILNTLTVEGEATFSNGVTCSEGSGVDGGYVNVYDVDTLTLTVDNDEATWQSKQVRFCSLTQQHYYCYAASSGSTQPVGTSTGRVVNAYTDATIHYLGKADT